MASSRSAGLFGDIINIAITLPSVPIAPCTRGPQAYVPTFNDGWMRAFQPNYEAAAGQRHESTTSLVLCVHLKLVLMTFEGSNSLLKISRSVGPLFEEPFEPLSKTKTMLEKAPWNSCSQKRSSLHMLATWTAGLRNPKPTPKEPMHKSGCCRKAAILSTVLIFSFMSSRSWLKE